MSAELGILGISASDMHKSNISLVVPGEPPDSADQLFDVLYPSDSGVINVKDSPYNAKGDGVTDDTSAIIQALNAAGEHPLPVTPVFLPAGTYLVSDTLRKTLADTFPGGDMNLYGEGETKTFIQLKDSATGFNDTGNPKSIILTASYCFPGPPENCDLNKDYSNDGEGNAAFRNFLRDFTVNTGTGNAGTVGVNFLANNSGGMRHIKVVAGGDGSGIAGISMKRKWPGPAMLKNIIVEGFDYSVDVDQSQYSMVIEFLTVKDQKVAGLRNNKNVLSIRKMTSTNTVDAIINQGDFALMTILDSVFDSGITNSDNAHLITRNVVATGGHPLGDFNSHPTSTLFSPTPSVPLGLPIKETPMEPYEPSNLWTNVQDFGAVAETSPTVDNTPKIQAAIDAAGTTTLYFPNGRYGIKSTIFLRGDVRHIVGVQSVLVNMSGHTWGDVGNKTPVWSIEDGTSDTVFLADLGFDFKFFRSPIAVGAITYEVNTNRIFVLGESKMGSLSLLGSGDVFLENVCCPRTENSGGGDLWMRQFNIEGDSIDPGILNSGGNVWIFGIKTEGNQTPIKGINGSSTEVFGGLFFPTTDIADTLPAVRIIDSYLSCSFSVISNNPARNYTILVQETRGGETKDLLETDVPARPGDSQMLPLYVGAGG